jgi:hypothetical protein
MDVLMEKTSITEGLSIATFDYQRAMTIEHL